MAFAAPYTLVKLYQQKYLADLCIGMFTEWGQATGFSFLHLYLIKWPNLISL